MKLNRKCGARAHTDVIDQGESERDFEQSQHNKKLSGRASAWDPS